ncbi:hypothetical protein [Microbacterium sp. CGR1]|uniref:hypothetical protein n=1 Tax=Microbacterium sp. CGR1 TaxID=1696072 RepID=UPI003DA64415
MTLVRSLVVDDSGGSMSTRIHLDFGGVGAVASSLQELTSGSADGIGLDLSAMRSDLVTSAGRAFIEGWSDALIIFDLTSSGLAIGVDETMKDFLAAERAHVDSLTTSIGALDQ